ncbi:hypothetical protein [Paraburkholderia azotifigens]|uniref:Uncharacterized protein n=1 Tax=Paraburkholderia azotifigens TaxID=2057004 RepID=A0A5C6V8R3_9BURK|nr:hypothetical protein [Paraburkholderia azotifigens]TXC81130.1 hypothetical protein FRZ40_31895 [Paraburkholderia azotifigens]
MEVHRIVVRARIGELRAVPVWRDVMQLGLRVGEWTISVDRELNVESLSLDVLGMRQTDVNELRTRLRSALPSALAVDVYQPGIPETNTRLRR